MPDGQTCPCGSSKSYSACCGPHIERAKLPLTAAALMRSRYCAFVLNAEDYLRHTWHPSTRPAALDSARQAAVKWLGLRVLETRAGEEKDVKGTVEFVARYKVNGRAARLHEVSNFVKENGQWFYVNGTIQPARKKPCRT